MADPTPTECSHCGAVDTAPKSNVARFDPQNPDAGWVATSTHFDCLSVAEERELREAAQEEGSGPKNSAIIDACKGDGIQNDDLRELIVSGGLPVAEGLAAKRQTESEQSGDDK
jgi:hypothetical protein